MFRTIRRHRTVLLILTGLLALAAFAAAVNLGAARIATATAPRAESNAVHAEVPDRPVPGRDYGWDPAPAYRDGHDTSLDESDLAKGRPGDDNADGIIDEDESGWDCRTMGNRQCGPDPLVAAYNGGWQAGEGDFRDGSKPTPPDAIGDSDDPVTVAWNDGWIDGQADLLGDDNRDGHVSKGESGWDSRTGR